ncbi:MAG: response regulator [Myxococcales bacterium]|jgi:DNA-binding response OmpR family regulator|nr:response regulator [Myxococcales bacterium]
MTQPPPNAPQAPVRKILIVDDDHPTREMLKLALELEGYQVAEASNGLRLLGNLQVDRPDLVLLDVHMSWIDGFELCRSIKGNPELCQIPIVFLSGCRSEQEVRQGLAAGADDYFTKPVDLDVLRTRLHELIERGSAEDR